MKAITSLKDIQKIQIDILKEFDDFCNTHNLRYYLAGGTLLGAIRHKGFIPWDDDIDVIMPRPDYNLFIKLTQNGMGNDKKVVCTENSKSYVYPFAKITDERTLLIEDIATKENNGIYIDVFPMDGVPKNDIEIKKHFSKIYKYKRALHLSFVRIDQGKNIFTIMSKRIILPIFKMIGHEYFINKLNKIALKYNFEESENVAVCVWGYDDREVINKSEYITPVRVLFENEYFNAPSNYHKYLTNLYGDYMKLPPEEKRVSHHSYKAYWKE